jgi:hypothetical protein
MLVKLTMLVPAPALSRGQWLSWCCPVSFEKYLHRRSIVASGHLGITLSHMISICTDVTSWPVAILVLAIAHYHQHRRYLVASGHLGVTHCQLPSAQALPRGQRPSWRYPLPITISTSVTSWPKAILALPIAHYHQHKRHLMASGHLGVTHCPLPSAQALPRGQRHP